MPSLRIHLTWAAVTLLVAAAWGQIVRRSPEPTAVASRNERPSPGPKATAAEAPKADAPAPPASAAAPATAPAEPAVSTEELRALIRGTREEQFRAQELLERMPTSELRIELTLELMRASDWTVRRNATIMARDFVPFDKAAPVLKDLLHADPVAAVREAAARSLGTSDREGVVDDLLRAFRSDDDFRVQAVCAEHLLRDHGQGGPAAEMVPRLGALLDHSDGTIRKNAVEMLDRLEQPQAFPYFVRALRDSTGDVRLEGINGIRFLGRADAVPLIEPLLRDPVADVRDAAEDTIRDLRRKK